PDSMIYKEQLIEEFEYDLSLKPHNIAIHGRIEGSNKLNGIRYTYTLSDSGREDLYCSDLKLTYNILPLGSEGQQDKAYLKMIPNPRKAFEKNEPLFAYYEIYNLAFDLGGNTHYTLDFTLIMVEERGGLLKRLGKIFRGKRQYRIATASEQRGSRRHESQFMNFDVSKAMPGSYQLQLKVIDHIMRKQTITTAEFELL
ncbi:MAG: hypothetical protein KAT15_07285, partial [Bacteroidales bacterium]|nr:hypothetical protein [Bacteroidales bacterium]